MFWSKATQKEWPPEDSREVEQDVEKTKRSKMENLHRQTMERQGKAVHRGRFTPGSSSPDGETAESSPGK